MRGLDPRIHLKKGFLRWIAGSSPAMTHNRSSGPGKTTLGNHFLTGRN
jgi:hypothetical protein